MTKESWVTIYGDYVTETEKALLLDVYANDKQWFPKSQIANIFEVRGCIKRGTVELAIKIPQWMVDEKGIV